VHWFFPAFKVEEGMGSEGKKKNALSLPKTTEFFERGCAPFFLPSYPEIDIVGEAEDGQSAIRCVEKLKTDS
jgi:hypothetical protein